MLFARCTGCGTVTVLDTDYDWVFKERKKKIKTEKTNKMHIQQNVTTETSRGKEQLWSEVVCLSTLLHLKTGESAVCWSLPGSVPLLLDNSSLPQLACGGMSVMSHCIGLEGRVVGADFSPPPSFLCVCVSGCVCLKWSCRTRSSTIKILLLFNAVCKMHRVWNCYSVGYRL